MRCYTCGTDLDGIQDYRIRLLVEEIGWKDYRDFDETIHQCDSCKKTLIRFFNTSNR